MSRMSIVLVVALVVIVLTSLALPQARVSARASATVPSDGPANERTLGLGQGVAMKLVRIPPGKFMMGSPVTETGRDDSEGPQREVTISKAFYMGACEVTQEQYEAVMGNNPSNFKDAKNPVGNVSWSDAVEFCTKVSAKTGTPVSLPTEAQWEYACRSGSKMAFTYGDDVDYSRLGDYAWYANNSETMPHPVGRKKPNAWGLYDMHGNVWEWCSDWHALSYANAETRDPQGPASGSLRVVRGGAWGSKGDLCRSASRFRLNPVLRYGIIGFRVVSAEKP